jgi:hypothetical protein
MRHARLGRAVIVAASILAVPSLGAADPPDTQGLIRERDAQRERLMQDDAERAQRELLDREQAERAARQRLDSRRIERMPAPSILLPGAPPNLNSGVMQPGVTNRAGEMSREDAARRDRLEHDRTLRSLEDAQRGASTVGRPEPWKPIGAR